MVPICPWSARWGEVVVNITYIPGTTYIVLVVGSFRETGIRVGIPGSLDASPMVYFHIPSCFPRTFPDVSSIIRPL